MNELTTSHFLVTLCNQSASVTHSLCIVDATDGGLGWIDLAQIGTRYANDIGGFCGACSYEDKVIVCSQSFWNPSLFVIDVSTGEITCSYSLTGVKDPHSLVFDNGAFYLVSTGTNEIVRIEFNGTTFTNHEVFWRYKETDPTRDDVHLNGLTTSLNGLIASCFGPRQADGKWGTKGSVFYVNSYASIFDDLNQPHSPVVIDNRIFYVESNEGKLYFSELKDHGGWEVARTIDLGGYLRGITSYGNRILVGVSSNRNRSRSRKVAVAGANHYSNAKLLAVEPDGDGVEVIFDFSPFAREIYDIVPVASCFPLSSPFVALKERIGEMENTIDRLEIHLQALLESRGDDDASVTW